MQSLRRHFQTDCKAAFDSMVNWVGIIGATASLFNLLVNLLSLDLNSVFSLLLGGYRTVFHGAFDFLLGSWLHAIFPTLDVPSWAKDIMVIYFLIGSSLQRALWPTFVSIKRNIFEGVGYTEGIASATIVRLGRVGAFLHRFAYIGLWPLFFRTILKRPVLYEERERDWQDESDFRRFRLSSFPYRDLPFTSALERRYCYNVTVMLGLQCLVSIIAVLFLAATNTL